MHNTMYVNCPKRLSREILQKTKRDCPNRANSDQIVLGMVRREAGPRKRWPKALKTKLAQGGHQALHISDTSKNEGYGRST